MHAVQHTAQTTGNLGNALQQLLVSVLSALLHSESELHSVWRNSDDGAEAAMSSDREPFIQYYIKSLTLPLNVKLRDNYLISYYLYLALV